MATTVVRTHLEVASDLLDIARKTTAQVQANQSPVDTVLPDSSTVAPAPAIQPPR